MVQVECVECGGAVSVPADAMQGEILTCGDCGIELEVVATAPVRVDVAPMEMEDWGE